MHVRDLLVVEEVCGEHLVLHLVVLLGCEAWLHVRMVLGLAYQVRWRVCVLADEVDPAKRESGFELLLHLFKGDELAWVVNLSHHVLLLLLRDRASSFGGADACASGQFPVLHRLAAHEVACTGRARSGGAGSALGLPAKRFEIG